VNVLLTKRKRIYPSQPSVSGTEDIERIKDLLNLSQKELKLKQQLISLVIAVKAGVKLRNIKDPSDD
jgi:hypothetical protein